MCVDVTKSFLDRVNWVCKQESLKKSEKGSMGSHLESIKERKEHAVK